MEDKKEMVDWVITQIRDIDTRYFNVCINYSKEKQKNELITKLFEYLKPEYDNSYLMRDRNEAAELWKIKNGFAVIDYDSLAEFKNSAIQMDFDMVMASYEAREVSVVTFKKNKSVANKLGAYANLEIELDKYET